MIAIPNMDKPKGCWLCIFQIVNLEGWANGCVLDHSIQSADWNEDTVDDCPLIEIADDIWESEKYKLIRMTNEERINKAMAERRTDE